MIFHLFLIGVIYLIIILTLTFFATLYFSSGTVAKNDLRRIIPFYSQFFNIILSSYSLFKLSIILLISTAISTIFTVFFDNWISNSAIIFFISFFVFPVLVKSFENTMVTMGSSIRDSIVNTFIEYHPIILLGYGTANGAGLIYNWMVMKEVNFLWFLINFLITSILVGIIIKNTVSVKQ